MYFWSFFYPAIKKKKKKKKKKTLILKCYYEKYFDVYIFNNLFQCWCCSGWLEEIMCCSHQNITGTPLPGLLVSSITASSSSSISILMTSSGQQTKAFHSKCPPHPLTYHYSFHTQNIIDRIRAKPFSIIRLNIPKHFFSIPISKFYIMIHCTLF